MAPKQIAAGQWHGGSEAHVVEDLDEVSDGSFFRLDQSLACAQSVCVCHKPFAFTGLGFNSLRGTVAGGT